MRLIPFCGHARPELAGRQGMDETMEALNDQFVDGRTR